MALKELSDFIEFIEKLYESKNMSRPDLDSILTMKDAFEDQLPRRFNDLIQQFGRQTDDNPDYADYGQFLHRLLTIYNTSRNLPNSRTYNLDDELVPTFELDTNDKSRVFDLCAQMRKIVFASETFDQPHRRRLLNRIAAIEKQIEQPKGMLDVIRGGVSDIGETLGKFGGDIKPLTDRMAEVMQITRAGSKEYEKLPAPEEVKQLPKPSEEEEAKDK